MIQSCLDGGGIGAIIYDAYDRPTANWTVNYSPLTVVTVSRSVGVTLVNQKIGSTVTIGDAGNNNVEYTYTLMSGTSMATPHVTAAAALLWSYFGNSCTNHQIRYAMAVTAYDPNPTTAPGCDEHFGYGIPKTKNAYQWLLAHPCNTWSVPKKSQGGCTTYQN